MYAYMYAWCVPAYVPRSMLELMRSNTSGNSRAAPAFVRERSEERSREQFVTTRNNRFTVLESLTPSTYFSAQVPIVKTRLTLQHPNDSHHSTSSYSGQPGHRSTTSGRKFSFAADISMGVANGVAAVYLVRRMVELMPPLRPLVLVLKACLKEAGLNEVFTGGELLCCVASGSRSLRTHG